MPSDCFSLLMTLVIGLVFFGAIIVLLVSKVRFKSTFFIGSLDPNKKR